MRGDQACPSPRRSSAHASVPWRPLPRRAGTRRGPWRGCRCRPSPHRRTLGIEAAGRFPLCQHRARAVASRPTQRRPVAGPDRRPADRRVQGGARPHQRPRRSVAGFVWRLQTDEGNATALHPIEDDELVAINMSVWESIEALADYVYRSDHTAYLRRRREWFERYGRSFLVLWWVPAGHIPSIDEAFDSPRRSRSARPDRGRLHVRQAVRARPECRRRARRRRARRLPGVTERRSLRRRAGRGRRCRSTGGAACSSPAPRSGGCARG